MFKAGAAKTDITPEVGCWLEGIPRAEPSNAIHDPLHARALVLEFSSGTQGSEGKICLVTCDLIGLTAAVFVNGLEEASGENVFDDYAYIPRVFLPKLQHDADVTDEQVSIMMERNRQPVLAFRE
jgi:hypothetical protein